MIGTRLRRDVRMNGRRLRREETISLIAAD
jgi:hypothetical protein